MEIILCEKCGQTFYKELQMNSCPQCHQELLEKIQTTWFERELENSLTWNSEVRRKREVWELNVQERLERLLKKIPATIVMNKDIVESVRLIPVAEREVFYDNLNLLLNRLEEHHSWWLKVLHELKKPPEVALVNSDDSQ